MTEQQVHEVRQKIAGLHFAKESLKKGEQEILWLAEQMDLEVYRLREALFAMLRPDLSREELREKVMEALGMEGL